METTMTDEAIPESLRAWAESSPEPDAKLNALMPVYAEALDCQRCILYARQPDLRRATTTHAWWSDDPLRGHVGLLVDR